MQMIKSKIDALFSQYDKEQALSKEFNDACTKSNELRVDLCNELKRFPDINKLAEGRHTINLDGSIFVIIKGKEGDINNVSRVEDFAFKIDTKNIMMDDSGDLSKEHPDPRYQPHINSSKDDT